jgi:Ca2+-binding EF-hand superfamily protein
MWHAGPLASLLAVLGLTAVPVALAQTLRPSPAFQATDTNRDGQVDRAEYQSHVRDVFSSLDRDKDGVLTGSELPNVTAEAIRAADGDSDGKLTAIEYMNQRLKEFADADRNRDGVLTQAELEGYGGVTLFRWR